MSNAEQTTKQLFHGLADLRQRIAELDRAAKQDEKQSLKTELEETRKALEARMAERTAALQRLQRANERLQAEITQRTQAEQHLAIQVARLQTLTRLNQLISSPLDMSHLLREIARAASRLIDRSIVTFWIVDERAQAVEARAFSDERVSVDLPSKKLSFDQEGVGWVATHRRPLNVPNIFKDARFDTHQWWDAHALQSFFGVPVMHEDTLLAVLAFSGQRPFRFGAQDRYLLENFVAQAAIAIMTAQLFRESEKQRRHWATLVNVAQRMTRGLNLRTVLNAIAEAAALVFEGEAGFRLLQGQFLVRIAATPGAREAMGQERVRIGDSLSGRVAATGKGIITSDSIDDPQLLTEQPTAMQAEHVGTMMCIPVGLGSRIMGTLHIYRERGHHFDQDARKLASSLANQAAIAIENARLFQQVQQQAEKLTEANATLRQDITERKQVTEALRASETRYRALVEGSVQGISIVSQDGHHLFANPALLDIFGYDSLDAYLSQPTEANIAPDDRDRLAAYRKSLLQNNPAPTRYEYQGVRTDGTLIWLERMVTPIEWKGEPALLSTVLDITERKHAEAEREQLENQLSKARKMEAIGTLAGGIAHDFNNILAAIIGYTELALYDVTDNSIPWKNLQEVLKASKRAKELVQQILAFSRHAEPVRAPIQLHLLIKEAVSFLRASLPSTINIQQHITQDADTVLADATQVHQVIMNLCTNAAHAMQDTGGVLEINSRAVDVDRIFAAHHPPLHPGPHVCVTISDTGHGMDDKTLERIFEPFFTTKKVGEGTGMGLAVAHGIVTSHGGAIVVQSKPGDGTTVAIYFPRLAETARAPESPVEPVPHGSERLLLIDDEEMLVNMGYDMLARLGYTVVAKTNSAEALDVFEAAPQSFDLVITDQTMPNMTGDSLVKKLRHIRPDIPIVLCTGFSPTMNADTAKEAGVDAFCQKPLQAHELAREIRRALDRRSTEVF